MYERKPTILVTNKAADIAVTEYTGDRSHNWVMYPRDITEKALVKHGYIPEGYKIQKYDTDKEVLVCGGAVYEEYVDYDRLRFRLKIADKFFRIMRWCYYMFRPM